MDKSFWKSIQANDYAIPNGFTAALLTPELLSYLGSPDPELREPIAKLGGNLSLGIREDGNDSIFLRSYSALLLAEMVNYDNKHPYLGEAEVRMLRLQALAYLGAEQDERGYIPGKGWAHACAHTADWLTVLARSRHIGAADLERILKGISAKTLAISNPVHIHDEDEWLVNTVSEVLKREMLTEECLSTWLDSLTHPASFIWEEAFLTEGGGHAYHNVKCFVRSLYLRLLKADPQSPHSTALLPKVKVTLQTISPWF
jgi:hypothetical protein